MRQAQAIGLAGLGLGDRNSVAGVVRAHLAKREQNWPLAYHPSAPAGVSPTARPTSSPTRATAPPRAGSAVCSPSAIARREGRMPSRPRRLVDWGAGMMLGLMIGSWAAMRRLLNRSPALGALPGPVRLAAAMLYRGRRPRRLAHRARTAGARSGRAARSPPTTCTITCPTAGRSPTCSPASARSSSSTAPAASSPPMPNAI